MANWLVTDRHVPDRLDALSPPYPHYRRTGARDDGFTFVAEDRTVTAARHDVEGRSGSRDTARPPARSDRAGRGRQRRGASAPGEREPLGTELHIGGVVGEARRERPECSDGRVALRMACTHRRPLALGARRRGGSTEESARRRDENHRRHARGRHRREVEERLGAEAHSDGADALDREVIEQFHDIARASREGKGAGRVRGAPVTAGVGADDTSSLRERGENELVVRAGEAWSKSSGSALVSECESS